MKGKGSRGENSNEGAKKITSHSSKIAVASHEEFVEETGKNAIQLPGMGIDNTSKSSN